MKQLYTRRKFIEKLGISSAAVPLLNTFGGVKEKSFSQMELLPSSKGTAKPNIIFILSDDHRYDFMGFTGKLSFLKTPAMDKMAKEGVQYKYMTYYGIWDTDELYDIKNDPNEMFNLIDLPEYKDLVEKMTKQVFNWLNANNANKILVKRTTNWQANKRKGNVIFTD